MLQYIYQSLTLFRNAFPRSSTWLMFCMVVLGFIGTHEMVGVTSFCRFWNLDAVGYHALIHFFRISVWPIDTVIAFWSTFVLSQNVAVKINERTVLLADHTCVPKDGRRMPAVVTLHQHSETQSKPSYFRGHFWGAVGMLSGSMASPFCIPLSLGIHQGLTHVNDDKTETEDKESLGTRIIQMALEFAVRHDLPSILVLDAFFPGAAVFLLAGSVWSIKYKRPLLTLVIRAKKNVVAYFEAEQPEIRPVGRPRKYGDKVKLSELFSNKEIFSEVECSIYGGKETVSIASMNLLWKPTKNLIRFVLAVSSRGPIILMCSDLHQDPVAALELYCARVRIETMFDMLKNVMGVFHYRFWTQKLPRHSRKPKKNKDLKRPKSEDLKKVACCFAAYERFVMLGAIALGFLQLISLKYGDSVWKEFRGFLRTKSRSLPSERTVKSVVGNLLVRDFFRFAPALMMQKIQAYCFKIKKAELGCQRSDLMPTSELTDVSS